MADIATKYEVKTFPLNTVSVVCDDCLRVVKIRRAGNYHLTCLVTCLCGTQEMTTKNWQFEVGPKHKVFLSTILMLSDRVKGTYSNTNSEYDVHRMLIEHDTGIVLEDDDAIRLFLWATSNGDEAFDELERKSTQLMDLYNKFKDVQHWADAPSKPRKKKS